MKISNQTIPFLNLKPLFDAHREEFLAALTSVIEKSGFIGGEEVTSFERNFANWVGNGLIAASCGNGTDAIAIAALSLRLPAGSEALLPAMTFVATAEGLLHAGFKIRLVDIQPGTWVMDPLLLEKTIRPDTRLIVPVHLYGQMAPMDSIRKIADRHGCLVLEDAAQAHGATWQAMGVGHFGDLATFSFYPGKNLGAFGDAGAIVSRDRERIEYASALTKHGGLRKYEHQYVGFNSRLDGIQAAVLNVKLKYINEWNEKRAGVAKLYRELLSDVPGLTLPVEAKEAGHIYHLYVVLVENREDFIAYLKDRGVETGVHYPKAIHQLPSFARESFAREKFPNAERLARCGVSLPMCPTLAMSQIEYVAETVCSYFKRCR